MKGTLDNDDGSVGDGDGCFVSLLHQTNDITNIINSLYIGCIIDCMI